MITWEYDLAWNKFSESASSETHIHLVILILAWKHNFRGAVVPSNNILCQILIFRLAQVTTQPEVTATGLALALTYQIFS